MNLCCLWLDIPICLENFSSQTQRVPKHHHFKIYQWIIYLYYTENILIFFVIESMLYETMSLTTDIFKMSMDWILAMN